jgi:soluble lytic murein transglycosylase
MQLFKILTPLLATALLATAAPVAFAQNQGDNTLLEMHQAHRKGDRKRMAQLLPAAQGHVLEPWAAYWELKARLAEAPPQEIKAFMQRYAGTYQEDRLRNDWLLLLGQRRDWAQFAENHPDYRMSDDREVRCYALLIDATQGKAPPDAAKDALSNWYALLRNTDDGCTHAVRQFYLAKQLSPLDVWRKARLAIEANRPQIARAALEIVAPEALNQLQDLNNAPSKYLLGRATAVSKARQELVLLALIKLASSDLDSAVSQLDNKWGVHLSQEERNWAWGVVGKVAAQRLSSDAAGYFDNVTREADLNDDLLGWKARAALRASRWKQVQKAIDAMSPEARKDSTWVYWKARAIMASKPSDAEREQARQMFASIASTHGFYEQLALEELGQPIVAPTPPAPLTAEEKAAARANPGLRRALYAISIGLRGEGVREWNYTTNLHTPGGMPDRELLAAADLACEREVWDRCINTSERTRSVADVRQRFPTPFRNAVVERSQSIGLDPAYVYGLIRQESRFIMDARSHVGASGLMQVMPATARWTAKKIGLDNFTPDQITDRDTNITIGTAYLKLALDDFAGSMPLAAAAYNAGPGRPRNWRNGPVLDAAIWAENVPFAETRDYVKKVLANTTNYAAMLTGQPQSLKRRLGTVGPREATASAINKDLP